jgi:hypothetical protein
MFFPLCFLFFVFETSAFGELSPQASAKPHYQDKKPTPHPKAQPSPLPLAEVVKEVKTAIDTYQASTGTHSLPPLQSVEFDFKVATKEVVKGSISFVIFSIGGSVSNATVNDVTYTYERPTPAPRALSEKPKILNQTLVQTIQEAAKAVKESGTLDDLKFTKLVVDVEFGVEWTLSAGGNFTYQFVTLNLGAEKNKNTVQSVKLTFKEPDKATPTPTPTPKST